MSGQNSQSNYPQPQTHAPPRHHPNTIYVANLNYDVKPTDIEKLFSEFADIKLSDIKQRENKAFVFVTFATRDDAKKAIAKYSKSEFMGRRLVVDWSNQAGESKPRQKVGSLTNHREKSPDQRKHVKRSSDRYDRNRDPSDSESRSKSKTRKDRKYHTSKSRSRSHEKPPRRREHNYFAEPRALLKMIAEGKSRHGSGVYEKIAGERLQSMISSKR